jgi:hypothetical protein
VEEIGDKSAPPITCISGSGRECAILAWDVAGNGDPAACIDIHPETLYGLDAIEDRLSVS